VDLILLVVADDADVEAVRAVVVDVSGERVTDIATRLDVAIEDRAVVNKSYPKFWDDLGAVGFQLELR